MRRYPIVLIALIAVLVVVSAASAQPYKFDVAPKVAPLGQVVKIVFENRLNTTIYLPPRPMWSIYDSANQLVYLAPGSSIYMPVRPLQKVEWPWMQRDNDNRPVKEGNYEARCYYTTGPGSPYLKAYFQIRDNVVVVKGDPRPGNKIDLELYSRSSAEFSYGVGLSFGTTPGIPVQKGRVLPLNYDFLFVLSQTVGAPVFQNFAGWFDAEGQAKAGLLIPNQSALRGYTFFAAFATFDRQAPGGIRDISLPAIITIR